MVLGAARNADKQIKSSNGLFGSEVGFDNLCDDWRQSGHSGHSPQVSCIKNQHLILWQWKLTIVTIIVSLLFWIVDNFVNNSQWPDVNTIIPCQFELKCMVTILCLTAILIRWKSPHTKLLQFYVGHLISKSYGSIDNGSLIKACSLQFGFIRCKNTQLDASVKNRWFRL